jgi:single-strand DNA-binding protein
MNTIVLQGIFQSAPELRSSQDGLLRTSAMLIFPAAKPEEPEHKIRVICFGELAEQVHASLHQGDAVIAEGRLQVESRPRPDGTKERTIELVARRIHTLGTAKPLPEAVPTTTVVQAVVPPATRRRQTPATSRPLAAAGVGDDIPF